jgi:hypothetical protein
MTDTGIGTYVRYWLHYGNMASSFFKQFGAVRKIRDDYEKQVIQQLQSNGMEKAIIQTQHGNIHIVEERQPNPLTLSKIEELLHLYYRQRGGKDETMDIMLFIRGNRGYVTHKSLRQSAQKRGASSRNATTPTPPLLPL